MRGKVGATITATPTPADANNIASYLWYADNAPILGAITDTYVVAAGDLGKKIKVVVTDTEGKTFESAETAAVISDQDVPVTGVAISENAPKVGKAVEAVLTPAGANNVIGYAWYALDKIDADYKTLIPVGTESSYTPSADDKGKYLQVVVTDANLVDFASAVSSIVTEDKAAEIKLVDKSGLQTDGTALPNDKLEVSYGSDLGTPKTIIWYCDGAAKDAYTLEGNAIATGFNNAAILLAGGGEMSEGVWYVSIENTEGVTSVTNTITVAKKNKAVISDFAIADDYATANAAGLTFASGDDTAVITVSLNKDYDGVLYVYKDSVTSYSDANYDAKFDITSALIDTKEDGKPYVAKYTKSSDMTEKNAVAAADKGDAAREAAGGGNATKYSLAGTAIKYIDKDTGKTTYKFVPEKGAAGTFATQKASLVRGSSYKLVFDQADIDSDNIGAVARKDVTPTESFEVPYVNAPVAIKVVGVTAGTNDQAASVEIYSDEACTEALTWLGDSTTGVTPANVGLTVKAFTNTKSNTTDGVEMPLTAGSVVKRGKLGGFTGTKTSADLAGIYATLRTDAGVYGKNSVNLTSEVASLPAQSVGEVKTSYDKKSPYAIKVSFTGLKTPGTVYVIRTDGATITDNDVKTSISNFNKDDASTYVKSTAVAKTDAEVVLEDVVDRIHSTTTPKDAYSAVFVPDNSDDFQQASTAVDGTTLGGANAKYCVVGQVGTTYKISGTATGVTIADKDTGAGGTTTSALLDTYDQFGNDMDTVQIGPANDSTAAATGNALGTTFVGASGASVEQKLKVAVNGKAVAGSAKKIYAEVDDDAANTGAAVGDIYKYKIEDGAFIQFKCTKAGTAGTAEWAISIVTE